MKKFSDLPDQVIQRALQTSINAKLAAIAERVKPEEQVMVGCFIGIGTMLAAGEHHQTPGDTRAEYLAFCAEAFDDLAKGMGYV